MKKRPKILLLFDSQEKDLARDFSDLFGELGLEALMIPNAPDLGKTLQDKERHYFEAADGAVVLITPGVERGGVKLPSPSVSDEMGQAKWRFEKKPERVIYLVDDTCSPQAIDQRAYIGFRRGDLRSIVNAITRLIGSLKAAGLLRTNILPMERRETPSVDIGAIAEQTSDTLKRICDDLSHLPSGSSEHAHFRNLLKGKYGMSEQEINFAERDLQTKGLVTYHVYDANPSTGWFALAPIGWELVRMAKKYRELSEAMMSVLSAVKQIRDASEKHSRDSVKT